jgi:hypothetical protein
MRIFPVITPPLRFGYKKGLWLDGLRYVSIEVLATILYNTHISQTIKVTGEDQEWWVYNKKDHITNVLFYVFLLYLCICAGFVIGLCAVKIVCK